MGKLRDAEENLEGRAARNTFLAPNHRTQAGAGAPVIPFFPEIPGFAELCGRSVPILRVVLQAK
jgi:hypothetical protein